MTTNPVAVAIASIDLGAEVTFDNLTMIPLLANVELRTSRLAPRNSRLAAPASPLQYATLDDVLHAGVAEVTEVSEHGSVPELRFVNRGAKPVLIVDGEELVGAKQNRVVNLTILVAAHTSTTIPVSCVEAGRWRAKSRAFTAAPRAQFATGRAKRVAQVTQSLRDRGDRMSDQAEVWAAISEKAARMHARSSTSAMEAIFDRHAASIDAYVNACAPVDRQVGAVFIVNGAVVGFDLFDEAETLRKLLPKLVRSAAVEAIDANGDAPGAHPSRPKPRALAEQFLAVAASAPQHVTNGVGLGDDVRITTAGIAGAALVVDGRALHVAAFAV